MYKVAFRYNHILVLELWISQELFCITLTLFFFLVSIMMYRQQMPNP